MKSSITVFSLPTFLLFGENIMDKFLNKENVIIVVCVVFTLVQMNYFATKLDVANLKIELMEYSQKQIEMSESKIDTKLDALSKKIDELIKSR